MAEQNPAPWTLTCQPAEVAACTARTRFSMTRGTWADPALAALLAPPVTVTVTVFTSRGTEAVMLLAPATAEGRGRYPTAGRRRSANAARRGKYSSLSRGSRPR